MKNEERVADELLVRFLQELKTAARSQLQRVQANTLQPTAVVNEVYLRLIRSEAAIPEDERAFLALASTAVRNAVLDYVRSKNRVKRSAGRARMDLEPLVVSIRERGFELVEVEDLLDNLRRDDPELATVVDFRIFLGFSIEETAEALGLSERTVDRRWQLARTMLAKEVSD